MHRTPTPVFRRSIDFAMGEKRIRPFPNFLALPGHHIDRVVQKDAADVSRGLRHENSRAWKTSHCHWQRADVISMGVRNEDRVDSLIGDCLQIWQRILPGV